jgi:hypothetical protein
MYHAQIFALEWLPMEMRNACQLRKLAKKYREMAAGDGDPTLRSGLMLLADEFDREAVIIDAREGPDGPQTPKCNHQL